MIRQHKLQHGTSPPLEVNIKKETSQMENEVNMVGACLEIEFSILH